MSLEGKRMACYFHALDKHQSHAFRKPTAVLDSLILSNRYPLFNPLPSAHHIRHLCTSPPFEHFLMFGASEDRARQLAYRQRRQRIVSGSSCSTYRSLSSTSQESQQSHTPSTLQHDLEPHSHRSLDTADAIAPTLAVDMQQSQAEQHRLQAEYLSQVLYGMPFLPATGRTKVTQPTTASTFELYRTLGYSPTSLHIRNMTAPIGNVDKYPMCPSSSQSHLGLQTLDNHFLAHTMVSLRGGGDDVPREQACQPPPPSQNNRALPSPQSDQIDLRGSSAQPQSSPRAPTVPFHEPSREYMTRYSFALDWYWRPEWATPISSGLAITDFRLHLPGEAVKATFFSLFGPSAPPTYTAGSSARLRRNFYHQLDDTDRLLFRQVIVSRQNELRDVGKGLPDPQALIPYSLSPQRVMLYHLLEAVERPGPLPANAPPISSDHVPYHSTQTSRAVSDTLGSSSTIGRMTLEQFEGFKEFVRQNGSYAAVEYLSTMGRRDSSAPDLGQRQGLSGHYSGGSAGTTGSTAARSALNKLFDTYREDAAGEPDSVGIDGTMKYFNELDVDLEGLESFAVSEIVQAPAMGEMTREAFVIGWQERNCETIDKQKSFIKSLKREMPANRELFERIYKYSFSIAKAANSKQAPLEQAIAFWDLLFSSPLSAIQWKSASTPWLDWWKEFLETSFKRSVNKDMWNETLKFAKLTLEDENMTFWTEESSWPSVIDEFVDWVKNEKRGGAKEETMDEEY